MLFSPGLYLPMGKRPAAASVASTTWNPADSGASFILTNGNLTATATNPPFSALGGRTVAGKSAGKYYFEIHIDSFTSGNIQVGIATSTWDEDSTMLNTTVGAIIRSDGVGGYNSSNFGSGLTFVTGDVFGVAVDFTNSKIWFRQNGGSWDGTTDDPATNTGGTSIAGFATPAFACAWLNGANTIAVTARFASGSWGFAAPSGFGQWG